VGAINLFVFFTETKDFLIFNAWKDYSVIDIHKIYYGAFVNLSFLMLLYLNLKKEIELKLLGCLMPVFILLLMYAGSISNILIYLMLVILWIGYKFFFSFYKTIYLTLIFGVILIFGSLSTTYGKKIFEKIDGENSRVRNHVVNSSLISKSYIFGYGVGNELKTMQKARNNKSWEYRNAYNAHNQYFQYLIGGGFVYLIFALFPIFYINIKDKKLTQNLFANGTSLILTYIFLIESFGQRQHGQIFFSFFITLIILDANKDKIK
jgi:hypothetical protein